MNKIKTLLSNPKKIAFLAAGIAAAIALLAAGSVFTVHAVVENKSIGRDAAVETAIADAGYTQQDVTLTKSELSYDDGMFVYEIEFFADRVEHDYTIKASNGIILVSEHDGKDVLLSATQPVVSMISLSEAKNAALEDAKLAAANVIFTKTKLDGDDSRAHYDLTFISEKGEYKYEYEIDAVTGEVITKETDKNPGVVDEKQTENSQTKPEKTPETQGSKPQKNTQPVNTQSQPADAIDTNKAKEIAAQHAGFSSADVRFTKTKLDYDDGAKVYEIEFVKDRVEYDYEINAATGAIIDFDKDYDD